MTIAADDPLVQLAERITVAAGKMGIATALIGATALAAHNYVRGTADIDLAAAVFGRRPRSDHRPPCAAQRSHISSR